MRENRPFCGPSTSGRWRRRLLLAAAMSLGAVAHAQDGAIGFAFLPLPEDVPGTLTESLTAAEDPAELAHEIRGSVAAAAPAPPAGEQPLPTSVEPVALMSTGVSEAVEASIGAGEGEAAPTSGSAVISVIVENVETSGGTVNIGLCDKGLSRETCPYDKEVRASQGFVEVTFDSVPPGNYAVVAYHDVNGNGEFDRFLGMPREPYALSGRAGSQMVPSFESAALPIRGGENAVVIRLKRLVGR